MFGLESNLIMGAHSLSLSLSFSDSVSVCEFYYRNGTRNPPSNNKRFLVAGITAETPKPACSWRAAPINSIIKFNNLGSNFISHISQCAQMNILTAAAIAVVVAEAIISLLLLLPGAWFIWANK